MRSQPEYRPRSHRPVNAAWDAFVHRLATALMHIQPGRFLILEVAATGRYVQFAAEDDGIRGAVRAEAAGEYWMAADDPGYSESQRFRLQALGWTPPNVPRGAPEYCERLPNAEANWYVVLPLPADMGALALLAARTLRGVFGAITPRDLVYRAFHNDGRQFIVDLGIQRAGDEDVH